MKIMISDKSCEDVICTRWQIDDLKKYMRRSEELETIFNLNSFNSAPCMNCLNNPKNGGSGICCCTLGLNVTY